MIDWKTLNITDGADRRHRRSPVLACEQFKVDELSFETLLAMGVEFASEIEYYSLKNEKTGSHWDDLFEADEAVIMAMIVGTDLRRLESDFIKIPVDRLVERTNFLFAMATKINVCFTRLNSCHHKMGELLALKIGKVIDQKLSVELHNLGTITAHIGSQSKDYNIPNYSIFHRIWGVDNSDDADQFYRSNITDLKNPQKLSRLITRLFYVFLNANVHLRSVTEGILQKSLKSQQHNPAIGLFIVFLKLYEKAQEKINKFTERHLDFYYDKVLGVKKMDQIADKFYLIFETFPDTSKAQINKNTEFSQGKNSDLEEILYFSDETVVITDAIVSSLATLYLQRDKLVSPENKLGYVTRMKNGYPELPEPGTAGEKESASWPLFGVERQGAMKSTATDSHIGFCIASTVLLLEQGERIIELGIEFDMDLDSRLNNLARSKQANLYESKNEQFVTLANELKHLLFAHGMLGFDKNNSLQKIISKAQELLPSSLAENIKQLSDENWKELFYSLSRAMFSIKLTAEQGWLDIPNYTVVPYSEKEQKMGLRILFRLGQKIASITNYQSSIHSGNFDTELPVLQCEINPLANFCTYSLFNGLVVKSLQIDVDVRGVKNLQLYNQHGQLDPSKPFQPFGPVPKINSYIVFGSYEIAKKKIRKLTINLEWAELPANIDGFNGYYRGYETTYTNQSFEGKLSVLSDGSWQPRDSKILKGFNLFNIEKNGNQLTPNRTIPIIKPYYAKPISSSIIEENFEYNQNTKNGFFRMSLDKPETAFGHADYSFVVTRILSENAKRKLKKLEPLPNTPYTPVLNRISLDYKARSTINTSFGSFTSSRLAEKLIHLHPFGFETVYPSPENNTCCLIPQYSSEGNLFIGLTATDISGPLTLYFHINENSEHEVSTIGTEFEWFYLCSNIWKIITSERVLSDTTFGFLSSGRVRLNIPKDINRNNSIMPGDYFWLRVSSKYRLTELRRCHSVQTHALVVSKKGVEQDNENSSPGETVSWRPVKSISGINRVTQGYKAFTGQEQENAFDKARRVSERLRHKNRAILPWDFEHLVLHENQDIYKVKCFPNMSSTKSKMQPGNVLIVVVSDSLLSTGGASSRAMVNPKQLVLIKNSLLGLCSPFTTLEVRNPVYELVQVRCTVCFADSSNEGENINQLNRDISNYISPWKKGGYEGRFGWIIRLQDIESYIHSLSYVNHVTNFSMLHITEGKKENYRLFDTVNKTEEDKTVKNETEIEPRYPWSFVLPMENHFIETIQQPASIDAEKTGIDELAIGTTFIISGVK